MRRSSKIVKLGRHFTSQQSRRLASTSEITHGGSKSFWAQVAVEDLPETNVDLELYRRHNSSFPYIEKQLVVGKIVSVERNHVAIDTGVADVAFYSVCTGSTSSILLSRLRDQYKSSHLLRRPEDVDKFCKERAAPEPAGEEPGCNCQKQRPRLQGR